MTRKHIPIGDDVALKALIDSESSPGGSSAAVAATLTLDGQDDASGDVVYTAVSAGGPGNGIAIEQTTDDIDESLDVTVGGTQIRVVLATDHDGLVTSTASDVVAAVNADPQASLLVAASPGGSGAGLAGQNDGRLSGGLSADAVTTPFSGARYPIQDDGNPFRLAGSSTFRIHLGGGTFAEPHYDTDGYGSLNGNGYTDGYLRPPRDGYYRMTGEIAADFSGSDSTIVNALIESPDRDNEWDTADHAVLTPPAADGTDWATVTVTHWLAVGDRVGFTADGDGSTKPSCHGAFEIEFLGDGANPAV